VQGADVTLSGRHSRWPAPVQSSGLAVELVHDAAHKAEGRLALQPLAQLCGLLGAKPRPQRGVTLAQEAEAVDAHKRRLLDELPKVYSQPACRRVLACRGKATRDALLKHTSLTNCSMQWTVTCNYTTIPQEHWLVVAKC
jgi:hypothetical protein